MIYGRTKPKIEVCGWLLQTISLIICQENYQNIPPYFMAFIMECNKELNILHSSNQVRGKK